MAGLKIFLTAVVVLALTEGKTSAKTSPAPETQPGGDKLLAELERPTGSVAAVDLRLGSGILRPAPLADPRELKVVAAPGSPAAKQESKSVDDDLVLSAEYRGAFVAIGDCPVEVARRRGVSTADVDADTLRLRWTSEPSGRTRDVQAIAVSATAPAVVTCAERVLATWSLLSPERKPEVFERTFSFHKSAAGRRVR